MSNGISNNIGSAADGKYNTTDGGDTSDDSRNDIGTSDEGNTYTNIDDGCEAAKCDITNDYCARGGDKNCDSNDVGTPKDVIETDGREGCTIGVQHSGCTNNDIFCDIFWSIFNVLLYLCKYQLAA